MNRRITLLLICLVVSLFQNGCSGTAADDLGEPEGRAQQALWAENALALNALTWNSITTNSITTNSITTNSITTNSITTNSLLMDALTYDENSRIVFRYIATCALSPGQWVGYTTYYDETYWVEGQVGIRPDWNYDDGYCDWDCQTAISACVIARINYWGQPVPISLRGGPRWLWADGDEKYYFPNVEAAYFGNIFMDPQDRYACLPPGSSGYLRSCNEWGEDCGVSIVGECECGQDEDIGAFAGCPYWDNGYYPLTVYLQ